MSDKKNAILSLKTIIKRKQEDDEGGSEKVYERRKRDTLEGTTAEGESFKVRRSFDEDDDSWESKKKDMVDSGHKIEQIGYQDDAVNRDKHSKENLENEFSKAKEATRKAKERVKALKILRSQGLE